jgi:hypothetical protein
MKFPLAVRVRQHMRFRPRFEVCEDRCLMSVDTLITVGSPTSPYSNNKQNEPALAVDAHNPQVLAAGANDQIDFGANDPTNFPQGGFVPGVGVSGIYFSTDGGATWVQPTYTGWTARGNTGEEGPIGTLPNYYKNGLVSDGDPALAFGPRPGPSGFSWANGSRLYYANLTSNFSSVRSEEAFKGFEAIAVSRTDNIASAVAGDNSAWMDPVIVSRQNSALFSDKDAIWADNAASSPYFGNVYVSWTSFRGQEKSPYAAPEPILFSRSTDGGETWSNPVQLSAAANNIAVGGRQGSTIRTDSHGVVYVFWEGTYNGHSEQFMARSFDGGTTFERPRPVASVVDVGQFDPVQGRYTFDGVAGARTDSFPSVDIANGAPTGQGAPNTIVLTWADASNGLNHEQALVQVGSPNSTDGGVTWTAPVNAAQSRDRPDFPAVAISPDGQNIYLTYDAFLQPWQMTTANPRLMQGVVRHANFGSLDNWSDLHRGMEGDARATNVLSFAFEFLGDYNSIVATNHSAYAVWNDVRNAADCPDVDAYRQALYNSILSSSPPPTMPNFTACLATNFGNSDIFGGPLPPPASILSASGTAT